MTQRDESTADETSRAAAGRESLDDDAPKRFATAAKDLRDEDAWKVRGLILCRCLAGLGPTKTSTNLPAMYKPGRLHTY